MVTKLRLVFAITALFISFYGFSQATYWQREMLQNKPISSSLQHIDLDKAQLFSLKEEGLAKQLPTSKGIKEDYTIVYFPDENGQILAFRVQETSLMAPSLAARYPQIKSYSGFGLQNPGDKISFSVSPHGIQSIIRHSDKRRNTFMQKSNKGEDAYVVYTKDSFNSKEDDFLCATQIAAQKSGVTSTFKLTEDRVLRKFRIAVSASGEYTAYHGGEVEDALAAINATITRVNAVFETDLGVTLELVENTDAVIFTNSLTDPYSGNLNTQVQNTLTSIIGEANYDVGHLFHEAENGGNAGAIGSVCIDNLKGSAFSSSRNPEGDAYDLDFVAHELGHQFGANHTWSFESEGTLVQAEPGSGTTIMGYAGITGVNDVASNGDDYFHYHSISQITEYLSTVSCGEVAPILSNAPVISPSGNFIIPRSTAFVLTGTAEDPDVDDVLTYTWEQIDNGVVTQSTFGPTRANGANFRSLRPTTSSQRYFPLLSRVVQGNLTQVNPAKNSAWETVSDIERELNFALTVRDNAIGGGQVVSDVVNIRVINNAGPFLVTSQSSAEVYTAGSIQTITWDVANTEKAPISAQTVDIRLSVNGGLTFPITLAENVVNDGSHEVLLSGISTTSARIMVIASDNIFLAVNSADFIIESSEIVLNFNDLQYDICSTDDLVVPFTYETYTGFSEEVTFSATDLPPGLAISFSPETAVVNSTPVAVTFSNIESLAPGIYPIGIQATSGTVTKEVIIQLNVDTTVFEPVQLLLPANDATAVPLRQQLEWEFSPLYSAYDVEIATDMAFTTIVESASVLFNSYLPESLEQNTTYFWRVKPKNSCGEGIFGQPLSFSTIEINCKTVTSKDPPLTISTVGTPTIFSRIAVIDDRTITDVNVILDIDHTFLSDLVVNLISPAGTKVTLISNSCGESRNLNAIFDDAGAAISCGNNPAISGTVRPLGSLASLNGESTLGEWVLEILDTAPADGGVLNSFSLEICVEGNFRPDADGDGVFDDGDDLCLGTPPGTEVNLQGCPVYRLPFNNFSVSLQSESCRSANDGVIAISAVEPLNYVVTIVGNGSTISGNFTSSYNVANLGAGSYSVCIVGTEGTRVYEEFCIEVTINEPDTLGILTALSLENKRATIGLSGGKVYYIELNDLIVQTQESEIILPLKNGRNSLKVYTDIQCQGLYEEVLFVEEEAMVYPNPIKDVAKLILGNSISEVVTVTLYGLNGKLIRNESHAVNSNEITLDFTGLSTGLYVIQVKGQQIQGTYKVLKE